MKIQTITFLLFLCSVISHAQEAEIIVDVPSIQKPWSNTQVNNAKEQFQFAIVTDRTGGHRSGIFMKGIRKLNLMQPEFVMSVGDLIEGYTEDTSRLYAEWDEFNGFIDSLEVPFFYVPGNHDITNKVMEDIWHEKFGVTYYHFKYKDVLFLCLNTEDNRRGAGRGTIDDEQFEYIEKTLRENEDVKWTFVFMHQPLWVQNDTKRWKDVEKLLEGRKHNVYAGHYHRYWKTERNNGKYFALATTGGGSRLRGTSYGEFDHVVWMTMTENGPIMANLLLSGVWDENVVTDEISKFINSTPVYVKIDPVKHNQTTFSEETGLIHIKNESDYEMVVDLKIQATTDLVMLPEKYRIKVNPNSIEKVNYTLRNLKNTEIDKIKPILIEYDTRIEYPQRPDLVLRNSYRYRPVIKYTTPEKKGVKVDGNLREWKDLKYMFTDENMVGKPFNYSGEKDARVKFDHAYDDEYFYIAFEVEDDDLYINNDETPLKQDALLVGIDARNENISMYNSGRRSEEWIFILQSLKDDDAIYEGDKLPEGIISSIKKSKSGYSGEIAIPAKLLREKQGNDDWKYLRLNLGIYDFDQGGDEKSELYWKPLWNRPENIFGTGMIYKE